jgi:pseudouridine synthase
MPRRPDTSPLPLNDPARGERLQRVLADAGVAARRACEVLIETGRVKVNGRVCDRLPAFVDPASDRLEVDGRLVGKPERPVYLMLNKPTRVLTQPVAMDDDRPSALQMIDHPAKPRLVAAGGLDFDASGLLLFTNDGEVVNRLTHPRYGQERVYQVKVKGRPDGKTVAALAKGVYVYDTEDGSKAGAAAPEEPRHDRRMPGRTPAPRGRGDDRETPGFRRGKPAHARKVQMSVRIAGFTEGNSTLEVVVRNARDEEIVKALTLAGHPVRRIHRIAIGPLVLRELAMGRWRELTRHEVNAVVRAGGPDRKTRAGRPKNTGGPGEDRPEAPAPAPRPAAPRRRPRVIGGAPEDQG